MAYDATLTITASIEEILFTLALTFVLVVLVCYVFLQDWRATLIPSLAIPVSLLATFAVLMVMGYTINLLTLFRAGACHRPWWWTTPSWWWSACII